MFTLQGQENLQHPVVYSGAAQMKHSHAGLMSNAAFHKPASVEALSLQSSPPIQQLMKNRGVQDQAVFRQLVPQEPVLVARQSSTADASAVIPGMPRRSATQAAPARGQPSLRGLAPPSGAGVPYAEGRQAAYSGVKADAGFAKEALPSPRDGASTHSGSNPGLHATMSPLPSPRTSRVSTRQSLSNLSGCVDNVAAVHLPHDTQKPWSPPQELRKARPQDFDGEFRYQKSPVLTTPRHARRGNSMLKASPRELIWEPAPKDHQSPQSGPRCEGGTPRAAAAAAAAAAAPPQPLLSARQRGQVHMRSSLLLGGRERETELPVSPVEETPAAAAARCEMARMLRDEVRMSADQAAERPAPLKRAASLQTLSLRRHSWGGRERAESAEWRRSGSPALRRRHSDLTDANGVPNRQEPPKPAEDVITPISWRKQQAAQKESSPTSIFWQPKPVQVQKDWSQEITMPSPKFIQRATYTDHGLIFSSAGEDSSIGAPGRSTNAMNSPTVVWRRCADDDPLHVVVAVPPPGSGRRRFRQAPQPWDVLDARNELEAPPGRDRGREAASREREVYASRIFASSGAAEERRAARTRAAGGREAEDDLVVLRPADLGFLCTDSRLDKDVRARYTDVVASALKAQQLDLSAQNALRAMLSPRVERAKEARSGSRRLRVEQDLRSASRPCSRRKSEPSLFIYEALDHRCEVARCGRDGKAKMPAESHQPLQETLKTATAFKVKDEEVPRQDDSRASQRKRASMTSSQVRVGMGAAPALWDDGRAAAAPPPPQPPRAMMRSTKCGSWQERGTSGSLARDRYVDSVLQSATF